VISRGSRVEVSFRVFDGTWAVWYGTGDGSSMVRRRYGMVQVTGLRWYVGGMVWYR